MARALASGFRRRVILDSIGGEYSGLGVSISDTRALVQYWNANYQAPALGIVFTPGLGPRGGEGKQLAEFFRFASYTENCWVVVDEIDRYAGPAGMDPSLQWVLNYGRHRGISLLGVARRAARVHRDVTSQADILYLFQCREPRDLLYLSNFVEDEKELVSLEVGEYITCGETEGG